MHSTYTLTLLLLLLLTAASSVPAPENIEDKGTDIVGSISTTSQNDVSYFVESDTHSIGEDLTPEAIKYLSKRKGGGAGGGRGGGGGRGRGGGGGGGGSSGGRGVGGRLNNAGGRTTTGSGTPKIFSGFYYGGAGVPYTSGQRTPSGILPLFLGLSAASLFFAGAWLYSGIYSYRYANPVVYHNATNNANTTLPVLCLCQEYSVCGCDENHDKAFIDAMVANATASANGTVSRLVDVNGTRTLVVNGTLDNGTTADGGTVAVSGADAMQGAGMLMLAVVVAMGVVLL